MSGDISGLKAVFYTDGGCRPSRGIGGWGIHGYIFDDVEPKQGTGLKDWNVTPLGYKPEDPKKDAKKKNDVNVVRYLDVSGSLIPESTNNQAELTAVCQAMQYIHDKGLGDVMIWTDSQYVRKGLTEWLTGWVKRNWIKPDGAPVANQELWKQLLELQKQVEESGRKVVIDWVKGHNGDWGNEIADYNATLGVIAGKKGHSIHQLKERESKGYWNRKVEINRMFSNTYWYFNTNVGGAQKTPDGHTVYHLGEHGTDDDFLGKPMAGAAFSVIYTKDPEPVLEEIRSHQDVLDVDNFNSIVIGRLSNIFKPKLYHEIADHGNLFLLQPGVKLDIYSPDEEHRLTRELRPPRLAFNMLDVMGIMETLLNQTLEDPDKYQLAVTDITDLLYEVEEKKDKRVCKIKPTITSAVKSLSVGVNHPLKSPSGTCPVTITVGIDLPDRNTLAALAIRSPKVKVVTWKESAKAFRFATIVEAGDDVGIWAGFYSNLHLIT
jgi:ribonuclease HI